MTITARRTLTSHTAMGLMLALLAVPASASAEEAEADADRGAIVVTGLREKGTGAGTKTDTPLIETPQSITVIDGEELTRLNALSINQALGYVAGASPNQRGGMVSRYDQVVLRGFAPGVYLDGMRLLAGPYSMPQIDFNRIDHIDIVKGPASVLYGNSTPGGLVNLASKLPEPEASGRIDLAAGNYDFLRTAVDVNQPLDSDGRVLFRAVGGWQKADGFTAGTFSERYHISPMISFVPGPDTSLTLIAAYQHAPSGGGYSGVPAFGSVLPNPIGDLPEDINTGDPGYERYNHKQKAISALFRHDFNEGLTFRSNFRFQNNSLSYRQIYVAGFATTGTGSSRNTDYSTITRGGGGADEDFDTLTIDNHVNARFDTGSVHHNVLAGVDFQWITGENFQQFNTGQTTDPLTSIPNLNLFAPVYGASIPSFDLTVLSPAYTNAYSKRDQLGLYLQDQITIGGLHLIASGRKDWYRQTTLNKKNSTVSAFSQSAFTMRLGALYEFDFGLSPYFSFSESFEPQAGTTWDGTPFVPVTGRQYEGGLKFQPPGTQAIFTLSAFDLRRRNVPVGDPRAGTNGIPASSQVQIGEVRVRGVEFEARGEIARGTDVIAAASYTDAIITQGTLASGITPTTTGTRQLGVPKWLASAFLSHDFGKAGQTGGLGGLTLGGGFRYVGGSDGTTTYAVVNGANVFNRFTTRDFLLLDALIGYELGDIAPSLAGVGLSVNAANLLDKRHVTACPFNNSCYFGASRTVIGTLRYRW